MGALVSSTSRWLCNEQSAEDIHSRFGYFDYSQSLKSARWHLSLVSSMSHEPIILCRVKMLYRVLTKTCPSPLLSIQVLMCWFLRPVHYCRWIFSCFGVAQHPDSPIPFAWAIRDYINQDALFCKGREPEGSGGGWALLQRRPREAVLRPSRDRPWQLWRRLLCMGAKSSLWLTLTHCTWICEAKKKCLCLVSCCIPICE